MSRATSTALWLALLPCLPAVAAVPPPSDTPARILVSGRTSTAVDIVVVKVGQEIPATYAGEQARNTTGFDWYVSEHYALKSDMGDEFSREVLEVSELALPHWIAVTGLRPPDPSKRMYIVYGSSRERMTEAMRDDVGATWDGPGGGITIWNNRSAYNYPSGTLKYHRRDLVIHENLHMLQVVCLGRTMGTETMTYAAANHVFDEARRRLTVACFDKATINNPIDEGLTALRARPATLSSQIETIWQQGGGLGAVYQQFLWTDPDRALRWRLWLDEFYAGRLDWTSNAELAAEVFGQLDALDVAWADWLARAHHSFHHVQWGWEQSGDTFWSYGWPWNPEAYSQIDLRYRPDQPANHDPLRMDYPWEPMPPTVGPVERGGPTPSVGCVVDFSRDPDRGQGGLGLGVDGESHCPVTIDARRRLLIGGYTSGIAAQAFDIPEDLRQAAAGDGHRFGMTIRIAAAALEVAVRAGAGPAPREMKAAVPLTADQRRRLVSRPMAFIAKGGYQGVTPFIDDAREPTVDPTIPAPANRWRFAGWDRLTGLYRAAHTLGTTTPRSLTELRATMLRAVTGPPDQQAAALADYQAGIARVTAETQARGAPRERVEEALAELAGLTLRVAARQAEQPNQVILVATLATADFAGAGGFLTFGGGREPVTAPVSLRPGEQVVIERTVAVDPKALPTTLMVTANVGSAGAVRAPTASLDVGTSVPVWHVIGPFDNPAGSAGETAHPLDGAEPKLESTHAGRGGDVGWRLVRRHADLPATAPHVIDYNALFGPTENAQAHAVAYVDSDLATDAMLALGSDDGVVAWLNGAEVCRHLVPRGYSPRQERVRIRLQPGRNVLLAKTTQGDGDWRFGAEILSTTGRLLPGLRYAER